MTQINVIINDIILKEFRDVIFKISGLQRGDLKKHLELAIAEYIIKYTKSKDSRSFAKDFIQKLEKLD